MGIKKGETVTATKRWPLTVDEAVGVLRELLDDEDHARIASLPCDELIQLHMGLGNLIRNQFGLWQGNAALLEATGERDADAASAIIIEALWLRLREAVPKMH